jgi:uncharacterized protein (UPF0335 family)
VVGVERTMGVAVRQGSQAERPMTNLQTETQKKLRNVVDRIETLQQQQKELGADIKDIMTEAKSTGLDPKIIRKVLALRKKSDAERAEEEAIIATYCAALGMAGLPLGDYAERQLQAAE